MEGWPIRHDASAESSDPNAPGFIARPEGTPAYHGFSILPETATGGWVYGAITDYECDEPETEGDGFVIAPGGARAGIAWALDTPAFYEILPPDNKRWGVFGVCFFQPVSSVRDLVVNFRAVLPHLKKRYAELSGGHA